MYHQQLGIFLCYFSCHSGYECMFNMLSSFNKFISDKCFYFKTSENRRLPGVFSEYKMRILARNGLKMIEKNIWESYNESEVTHISVLAVFVELEYLQRQVIKSLEIYEICRIFTVQALCERCPNAEFLLVCIFPCSD